jgi:hypothetical protein
MKYLVFDAGPIISLSMNGLLYVLRPLKDGFDGEFIITPQVRRELIDRPIKDRKFKLEAIKVRRLLEEGVLKLSTDIVSSNKLEKETQSCLGKVN